MLVFIPVEDRFRSFAGLSREVNQVADDLATAGGEQHELASAFDRLKRHSLALRQ